ncbi:hypothetical protein G7054_g12612 [Neopestalotiopsis clavispora]|nr:hypothetical protein G7054_g12612 [Neopestalotiopsis clavispora]
MAAFERVFDINLENGQWPYKHYKHFITELRSRVADPAIPGGHLSLPVLLPQNPDNPPYFDLILLTELAKPSKNILQRGIRVRIRMDNLYLIGFTNEAGTPQWFEFLHEDRRQYIPGSTSLGFSGHYSTLDNKCPGNQARNTIPLGRQQLITAVNVLAKSTATTPHQTNAPHLLVIIQMFCEAMRFKYIRKYISSEVRGDYAASGRIPDQKCIDLETNWSAHSSAVNAQPGTSQEPIRSEEVGKKIEELGVLLRAELDEINYYKSIAASDTGRKEKKKSK